MRPRYPKLAINVFTKAWKSTNMKNKFQQENLAFISCSAAQFLLSVKLAFCVKVFLCTFQHLESTVDAGHMAYSYVTRGSVAFPELAATFSNQEPLKRIIPASQRLLKMSLIIFKVAVNRWTCLLNEGLPGKFFCRSSTGRGLLVGRNSEDEFKSCSIKWFGWFDLTIHWKAY